MNFWTGGLQNNGVTNLLASDVLTQVVKHETEHLSLAFVFCIGHHYEALSGFKVRVLLGTLDAHRGFANHAIESLKGAVDPSRSSEAVAESANLVGEVLLINFCHWAADFHVLQLWQGDFWDDFNIHRDFDRLAALDLNVSGCLVHLWVCNGLELVILQRLGVRIGQEPAAQVFHDRRAEALLDQADRCAAASEAGDIHLGASIGIRLGKALVHHRCWNGDLESLARRSNVLDDDGALSGHSVARSGLVSRSMSGSGESEAVYGDRRPSPNRADHFMRSISA